MQNHHAPLALAAVLLANVPALAQVAPGTARAWEHERSDLTVDPRIHFGQLENGFRYAWAKNAEPRDRCYVRLHVDVGSLAEEESERGLAHFLEHMAFNGSRNFPAGTLIEWFQEHGMAFGADLNAHTSYSETVYKLDLPNSDEATLREGLLVIQDWASGMLLEEAEIDAEKGVIDGEERERDSAGFRIMKRVLEEQFDGTLYPERITIGAKTARDAFTPESVRAFYAKWYRPENMTLIVVGDLGELDPTALIAEYFAGLTVPEAPVPSEPDVGEPSFGERSFLVHEPEIPQVSIHVERLVPWADDPDTVATRTEDVDLACARRMLNLRFSELLKQEGTPFLGAGVSSAGGLRVYDGEALGVTCDPKQWAAALDSAELELHRAIEFGFQEAELDEVRANWLRGLEEAVERESTRSSRGLVSELLAAAEGRYVPTDAAADRALLAPVIEALTVEECHAAFVEAWGAGALNLYATGGLDLGDDGGEELAAAYARAREREVEQGAALEALTFAYASEPEVVGEIAERSHIEDLDVELVQFANGVRLNVKQTDFKERQVLAQARVAEGLLTLEIGDYALGWLGSRAFNQGGLVEHTADDLRRLVAGRVIGVGLGMVEDTFLLGGSTTADDLLFQCELMCAFLTEPGWRDDGLRLIAKQIPLIFERLQHVTDGPLVLEFLPELFSGDTRFAQIPPQAELGTVAMDAIRAWLAPHLAEGPFEVTIVGDIDIEEVVATAARTFGVLPKRRAIEPWSEHRKAGPVRTGLRMERSIATEIPKSLVYMGFPTTDGMEAERRRHLTFLGVVLNDRLRLHVRERLGAAYSPGAQAVSNRVFPGIGVISITANADPDKVETLIDACDEVILDLALNGVTQSEVDRLKEPIIAQLRDARRTNEFWLTVLAEAQSRPDSLADIRTVDAFYADLSAEKLTELAQRYLAEGRASVLVVNPAEK